MKRIQSNLHPSCYLYSLSLGLMSALSLFCLSGFFAAQQPLEREQVSPTLLEPLTLEPLGEESWGTSLSAQPSPLVGADASQLVAVLRADGSIQEMDFQEYLWSVLAAEMPASFPLEALKAQAVAARSYGMLRLSQEKHSPAQLCDDSACCQAFLSWEERMESWGSQGDFYQEKLNTALAETDGLCVLYQEEPIDALFFSSSSGQTLGSQEVWGKAVPYLQSVASPDMSQDIPQYHSQVSYSAQALKAVVAERYPSLVLQEDPGTWFQEREENSAGGVAQVRLGDSTLTGAQLRTLLGLRSTQFEIQYLAEQEEQFTFTVVGYGHNVGMSQYGAKAMAEEGAGYQEILAWYYPGTQLAGYSAQIPLA